VWIHGHAIVCGLARITDATGAMPEALRFDADWQRFQAALDRANICLIGRRTHAAAPNLRRRRRLVVTAAATAELDDPCAIALDPAGENLHARIAADSGADAHVAVVGGTGVFDLAADQLGYHAFTLTVASAVRLDGGAPVFEGCLDLPALEARLRALGLERVETEVPAPAPAIRFEEWRRLS